MRSDFNLVYLRVNQILSSHALAIIETDRLVESKKAADVNQEIKLEPITSKDKEAIKTGKKRGIYKFVLIFACSREDINAMRELTGHGASIMSKFESKCRSSNSKEIITASNEILIDRGDLSSQVALEKIPFFATQNYFNSSLNEYSSLCID